MAEIERLPDLARFDSPQQRSNTSASGGKPDSSPRTSIRRKWPRADMELAR